MTTPKLGMPELSVSQASKEITHNQALAIVDQVSQLTVVSRTNTPPGSTTDGAAYIVTATATGAWTGKEGQIAYWLNSVAAWQFIVPANGWLAWSNADSKTYRRESGVWQELAVGSGGSTQCIPIACSDEVTALTAGTAKVTFRMPYAFTLTKVRASLTTAQSSGSIFTVDVNEYGTSILSTKITIDNTEKTSTTAAAQPVIADANLSDDSEITIDIDQIGNGTATGLKVYLIGVKS